MNYQETLDYLYSFSTSQRLPPGMPASMNLERTRLLLAALGDPQQAFPSVVVAGTKGKGSVSALIESIARAAGLRTGLWTSPHLHSYRERIQVDRQLISQPDLADLIGRVRAVVDAFDIERHGAPTVFMVGFVAALRYFAEQQVDLAVLEVGLGGRYDCANVVTPLVSVITSISYDHMHILGDTLGQIAYDKAGIIKPGVPAITVPQHPEAIEAIERAAAEVGGLVYVADACPAPLSSPHLRALNPYERYHGPREVGLRGRFQHENARLAVGAALLLRDAGLPIDDQAIARGLRSVSWPGRMELVAGQPPILLDGAHNGDSAHKLVESLREEFPGRRLAFVFGTMRDKDLPRILAELVPAGDAFVLTHSDHPRSLQELEQIAAQIEQRLAARDPRPEVLLRPGLAAAIDTARRAVGPDGLVCVTGSLFVVAGAREALGLPNEKD